MKKNNQNGQQNQITQNGNNRNGHSSENNPKIPSNPFTEDQLGEMRYAEALEKLL